MKTYAGHQSDKKYSDDCVLIHFSVGKNFQAVEDRILFEMSNIVWPSLSFYTVNEYNIRTNMFTYA